jgi:ATP diphosphatase
VQELAEATNEAERIEEAGDLLFAAVNVTRAYGVAPEEALRAANAKFERRYRGMETLSSEQGRDFAALSLDEQEELWQAVKRREKGLTV